MDETLVGGLEAGGGRRHLGKKALVVIAAEVRGRAIGRIRMQRVADASAASLLTFVQHAVQPGSVVITDGLQSYRRLPKRGYRHDRRVLLGRGESAEAVLPRVHRVASLLKRWRGHRSLLISRSVQLISMSLRPLERRGLVVRGRPAGRDTQIPPLVLPERLGEIDDLPHVITGVRE